METFDYRTYMRSYMQKYKKDNPVKVKIWGMRRRARYAKRKETIG